MLFVNTEELNEFGNYLITTKSDLDNLLKDLNDKMSGITSGWNDKEGVLFVEKFASFITEAQKISDEVNKMGTYTKTISSDYDGILKETLVRMGD